MLMEMPSGTKTANESSILLTTTCSLPDMTQADGKRCAETQMTIGSGSSPIPRVIFTEAVRHSCSASPRMKPIASTGILRKAGEYQMTSYTKLRMRAEQRSGGLESRSAAVFKDIVPTLFRPFCVRSAAAPRPAGPSPSRTPSRCPGLLPWVLAAPSFRPRPPKHSAASPAKR